MAWKQIAGYEGHYEVSDSGQIRSLLRVDAGGVVRGGHLMKASVNCKTGYLDVGLRKDGERKRVKVHSVVCTAFHGEKPSTKHEVRHLDGIKSNCSAKNLAWGTSGENGADKARHGSLKGSKNGQSVLKEENVKVIKKLLEEGLSGVGIASMFGVNKATIYDIKNGRRWTHV